jgi:aerotaxis receptor
MRKNLPVTQRERSFDPGQRLISITNLKGVIDYCNDEFVAVSGFSRDELIGSPHNLVRHPDMPPAVFANMWSYLKQGRSWMGVVKNRCRNGDHYWVSAYVTPVFEKGRMTGYESVRVVPERAAVARAERLYQRLQNGAGGGDSARPAQLAATLPWLAGAALPLLLYPLQPLAAAVAGAAAVSLLGLWQGHRLRRALQRPLALCEDAFHDPLVARLYTDARGAQAALEMAMISERARLNTALTRIDDAAERLTERAEASSALARSQAQALESQRVEAEQAATAMHEMAASIQDVARNVQASAVVGEETATLAAQGARKADVCAGAIADLAARVESINAAVANLADSMHVFICAANALAGVAEQT